MHLVPNTVQQAYRELEREGLAFVRCGRGTYVAALEDDEAERERSSLAAAVARRALREVRRHGLSPDELVEAIRLEVDGSDRSTRTSGGDG